MFVGCFAQGMLTNLLFVKDHVRPTELERTDEKWNFKTEIPISVLPAQGHVWDMILSFQVLQGPFTIICMNR